VISVDELLSITLIYSSIRHDVQYHEWRMNFHAHVYWYFVSFCLSVCVCVYVNAIDCRSIRLWIHTRLCVDIW
jgi:hypothetical protein